MLRQVISGLESGSWYGLVAVAIVVIWRLTDVPNFAIAEMGLFPVYVAWQFTEEGMAFWPAVLLGGVVAAVFAVLIEIIVIRPLEGRSHFPLLIATIGLSVAIKSLIGITWGTFPERFESSWATDNVTLLGERVPTNLLVTLGAALFVIVLLSGFFGTDLGTQMRAMAESRDIARLLGVRVGRSSMLAWAIGGVIAYAALTLQTWSTLLSDASGDTVILRAFVAAIIAGASSVAVAFVAGLLIGVAENLAGALISSQMKASVALVIVVVFLLARPAGYSGVGEQREF
ncbi:MAG: branched-chain amino acid ABC transporter permease [Acidimicrobiales bacterium]